MKSIGIAMVVIVVLVIGGYLLSRSPAPSPAAPVDQSATPTPPATPSPAAMAENAVVVYSDTGYAPSTVTVKSGSTVAFKNESSKSMWPASAMHPTHTAYSGTSLDSHCPDIAGVAFDACKGFLPGESWSFTFDKAGTWRYHNHLNPQSTGTVVVE